MTVCGDACVNLALTLFPDETVVLGHGHFGLVLKGVVRSSQSETRTDVAVKTLKTKVDVGSLKALLSELKILTSIGRNNNVVNLVGACTKKMGKGKGTLPFQLI